MTPLRPHRSVERLSVERLMTNGPTSRQVIDCYGAGHMVDKHQRDATEANQCEHMTMKRSDTRGR